MHLNPSAIEIDKDLTAITNLALMTHGCADKVKEALYRAIAGRKDHRQHQVLYAEWLDSRDLVRMALDKYRKYFGVAIENPSTGQYLPE